MNEKVDLQNIKKYLSSGQFYCKKHKTHDIYIFNYVDDFKDSIVWDDININLRGLVLDEDGNVLNRPVKKFFTIKDMLPNNQLLLSNGEIFNYQDKKYKVFDKVDGHLCYLFWYKNEPIITGHKSFSGKISEIALNILHDKYKDVLTKLDRTKSYAFELIVPEHRLIVDYGLIKDLILISIVDKKTGEIEPLKEIGFKIPEQFYTIKIFELNAVEGHNKEGVIIYFETGELVKFKTKWYYNAIKLLDSIIKCREKEIYLKAKIKKLVSDRSNSNVVTEDNQRTMDYNKELELSDFFKDVLYK